MLFEKNVGITDFWIREVNFKEGKLQAVRGRAQHSLSLRLGGEVSFVVDGKHYLSTQNCVTYMPAGRDYSTQIIQSGSMFVAQFNTSIDTPDARPLFLKNRFDLKPHFSRLSSLFSGGQENYYRSLSLFYEILHLISLPLQNVPRRIQNAKVRIDSQFSESLSVSALALEMGISEVYFRNEFKRYYGVSPLAYIKQVRIENAKQLLRSGFYSVTDVALECGFDSISYFSYEFKRLTGLTPLEYLKG